MEGIDIEQRREPNLVEQHETDEDERAGKQIGDIEIEAVHQKLLDTKRRSTASKPSIKAAPRNSGTRKTRILAMAVSNIARRIPPAASLATYAATPTSSGITSTPGRASPHGTKTQTMSET